MYIAFYAPMKPPDHPIPSGDRETALNLIAALREAGFRVEVVSTLRSWEGKGDAAEQEAIEQAAATERVRLAAAFRTNGAPDLWFTYHLYHKAPDWLGPAISVQLGIPYCLAEASLAPKQRHGNWSDGYAQTFVAIEQAARMFEFNPEDSLCIRDALGWEAPIVSLPPFLSASPARPDPSGRQKLRTRLAAEFGLDPARVWCLAVGMMREDAKRDSYRVLADAMRVRAGAPAHLLVVGDGPARGEIETMFEASVDTVFMGALPREHLSPLYGACDLFTWPAIREAFGMAVLEALAAGLPVVAANRPGVAAIVRDGETGILTPEGDVPAFAAAMDRLVDDPALRQSMSAAAVNVTEREHSLAGAAARLKSSLAPLVWRG